MERLVQRVPARLRLLCWVVLFLLLATAGTSPAGTPPPDEGDLLRVAVLDVGQGDAIVIQTPGGKTALIDAGPGKSRELLLAQLALLGVERIDAAFNTHPHEDHLGGFVAVLERYPVRLFSDSGAVHTTRAYENMLRELKARQVPARVARRGQVYKIGSGATLEVLAPTDAWFQQAAGELNNTSVVLRLTYHEFSMDLMGDAEVEVEDHLLGAGVAPAVVLKVGHHGSRSSSTSAFIDRLQVRVAIISCGADNRYGHPHRETLDTFRSRGVRVFRTDRDGQIRVLSDGSRMWVETFPRSRWQSAGATGTPKPANVEGPFDLEEIRARPVAPLGTAAPALSQPATAGDGATAAPRDAPAGYVASAKSKVFHLATCPYARRISPQNLQHYATREAAIGAGKSPARCCNP